ncbi:MAG: ATP-binding protein [Acidobacteriota bacterium]|nr:ATP-binding protein [Acidobacteriota bacterium]
MDRQFAGRHAQIEHQRAATAQVVEALDAFCNAEQIPDEVAWRLRVVLDEIVANIVTHGRAAAAGSQPAMDVWFRAESDAVEVTVADNGPAFNLLLHPEPDTSLPLESRQPGGLGITLIKSLMDEVRYERTDRNILTIRKGLRPAAATHHGTR